MIGAALEIFRESPGCVSILALVAVLTCVGIVLGWDLPSFEAGEEDE